MSVIDASSFHNGITVTGPGWSVRLVPDLETLEEGIEGISMRSLAVNVLALDPAQAPGGRDNVHFSSKMFVSGKINAITILPTYPGASAYRLSDLPAQFVVTPVLKADGRVQFNCESGEVPLPNFEDIPDCAAILDTLLPASTYGVRTLAINAAGFKIQGWAKLPWLDTYFLEQVTFIVAGQSGGAVPAGLSSEQGWFIMRVDPGDQQSLPLFESALATLRTMLGLVKVGSTPGWVNLALNDQAGVGALQWLVGSAAGHLVCDTTGVTFQPGSMVLNLTDQHPKSKLPTQTEANITPGRVLITRDDTVAPPTLTFAVLETAPAAVNAVTYTADGQSDGKVSETIALHGGDGPATPAHLVFDPVVVPTQLRQWLGQPPPVASQDSPGDRFVLMDPSLWVCLPLADGWAQLPLPNLSREIYYDVRNWVLWPKSNPAPVAPELPAAQPAPVAATPSPIPFAGALSIGNNRPELLRVTPVSDPSVHVTQPDAPARHPWAMDITGAADVTGKFVFQLAGPDHFQFLSATITLVEPQIELLGLLWFATKAPSPKDALPDHQFWSSSVLAVPLSNRRKDAEYKPVFGAWVSGFTATVTNSTNTPQFNPDYAKASFGFEYYPAEWQFWTTNLFPDDASSHQFSQFIPLAWQRDPTMPFVQNLPLLQTLTPPVYPSPNRQLMPRELGMAFAAITPGTTPGAVPVPFDGLQFVLPANALDWPQLGPGAVTKPPSELLLSGKANDLVAVSLTLPGLIQDPALGNELVPSRPDSGIPSGVYPRTLRHDLPYCDEPHALAQLPKTPNPSPDLVQPAVPEEPQTLTRNTMGDHWQATADLAALAAADSVRMISNSGTQVVGLFADAPWNASASLTINNGLPAIAIADGLANAPSYQDETALEGVTASFNYDLASGAFARQPDGSGSVRIVAGSMAGLIAGTDAARRLIDQRGLRRGITSTTATIPKLLVTPVDSPVDPKDGTAVVPPANPLAYQLISTSGTGLQLNLPGSIAWAKFWCRDLPCDTTTSFDRTKMGYGPCDCNDPNAISRARDFARGYEWRLIVPQAKAAPGTPAASAGPPPLPFHNLQLFPLQLLTFSLQKIAILARLQLPPRQLSSESPGGGMPGTDKSSVPIIELSQFHNDVTLNFTSTDGGNSYTLDPTLVTNPRGLTSPPDIEWPLALTDGEPAMAPRLCFTGLTAGSNSVTLTGLRLKFAALGELWEVPFADGSSGPWVDGQNLPLTARIDQNTIIGDLFGQELNVTLDAGQSPAHTATLDLEFKFGRNGIMTGDYTLDLLNPGSPTIPGGKFFGADVANLKMTHPNDWSFNLTWEDFLSGFHRPLLPGIPIDPGQKGHHNAGAVACQFEPKDRNPPPGFRQFQLTAGYIEAVLHCLTATDHSLFTIGDTLATAGSASVSTADLFQPIAGNLDLGFVAVWAPPQAPDQAPDQDPWNDSARLIANGFLEVNDLVSWPSHWLDILGDRSEVVVPSVSDPAGGHIRHAIRCCLNQVDLWPALTVNGSAAADEPLLVLTDLLEVPCAVEHQYLQIEPAPAGAFLAVASRRWTALQQVRFIAAKTFADTIQTIGNWEIFANTKPGILSPALKALLAVCDGYFREEFARVLGVFLNAVDPFTIVVEAAETFWLRLAPKGPPPTFSDLQVIPSGEMRAADLPMDEFEKYQLNAAGKILPWQLVQLPFLGRLARDGAWPDPLSFTIPPFPPNSSDNDLLNLFLCHHTAYPTATVQVAPADLDDHRTVNSLDEEMLARLQLARNADADPGHEQVPSVLEVRPNALAAKSTVETIVNRFAFQGTVAAGDSKLPSWMFSSILTFQSRIATFDKRKDDADRYPQSGKHPNHGWIAEGAAFLRGSLFRVEQDKVRYLQAATVAYTQFPAEDPASRSVTFVPSPYLALQMMPFVPTGDAQVPLAIVYDLIAATDSQAAAPVSLLQSDVYNRTNLPRSGPAEWGLAYLQTTIPTGIGIVRKGVVETNQGGPPTLRARYTFIPLSPSVPPPATGAILPLRASPGQLVFREVHFTGTSLPVDAPSAFEMAPPLIAQAYPLRVDSPTSATPTGDLRGDFGYSAYVTRAQVFQGGASANGDALEPTDRITMHWFSLQQQLQYRPDFPFDPRTLATEPTGGSGLPDDYVAEPIEGLTPLLPTAEPGAGIDPVALAQSHGQPVLPGQVTTLLVNSRPGAFYALRPTLMVQTVSPTASLAPIATSINASSVPCQARFPRPVPIPPNRAERPDLALQPWVDYFTAVDNPGAHMLKNPWDEVSQLQTMRPSQSTPTSSPPPPDAGGWHVEMQYPPYGYVDDQWDYRFQFLFTRLGNATAPTDWTLYLRIIDDSGAVLWPFPPDPPDPPAPPAPPAPVAPQKFPDLTGPFTVLDQDGDRARLFNALTQSTSQGLPVYASILAYPPTKDQQQTLSSYHQEIRLRLEVGNSSQLPMPVTPHFVRFEDPEYNARLTSATASSIYYVRRADAPPEFDPTTYVSLATDRQEYNPGDTVCYCLAYNLPLDQFSKPDSAPSTQPNSPLLTFSVRSSDGTEKTLQCSNIPSAQAIVSGQAYTLSLNDLTALGTSPASLQASDVLTITLHLLVTEKSGNKQIITLSVDLRIVAQPVNPAPDCAYGLLSRVMDDKKALLFEECAAFAWAPTPDRIEIVQPDDLQTGFVRRRAVFTWMHACRSVGDRQYFVQKIAPNGSTHFWGAK